MIEHTMDRKTGVCMMNFIGRCVFAAVLLLCGSLAATAQSNAQAEPADTFDWMASDAAESPIYRSVHDGRPDLASITGTTIPKPTANIADFGREYIIELERFNIHNDATHPVETSSGINQALAYAKTNNFNRIVFPKGTYLISETDPVIMDHQNTIIDLNQATLQINTNGLKRYSIVNIQAPAQNLRVTNGHIRGDRDTHDYKTVKASHEHCTGLTISGGNELEIDNINVSNLPGYGVTTRIYIGKGTRQFKWVRDTDLQSGKLSDDGQIIPSDEHLTTSEMYDVSNAIYGFEFGYTLGYQSYQSIKSRLYVAAFYDENKKFILSRNCLQFKKETIPEGAKFIRLQFNQAKAKNASEGMVGRITDLDFPSNVHFHHNLINNNRTLGLAFCGGQKWIIENNRFEDNGGNSPGFGVDFEDGWDLMREVVFRHNTFARNKAGDLVVCAGSEMIFSDNNFVNSVIFYDRANNYEFARNTVTGGQVLFRTGIKHAVVHHNTYSNVSLQVRWNDNNWPDVPPLRFTHETLDGLKGLSGRYLVFENSIIRNTNVTLWATNRLLALRGCTIDDLVIVLSKAATQPEVIIESSTITLTKKPLLDADVTGLGALKIAKNTIRNESNGSLIKIKQSSPRDAMLPMLPMLIVKNNITQKANAPVIVMDQSVTQQLNLDLSGTKANRPLR